MNKLLSALKFVAALISNPLCQTIRFILNAAQTIVLTASFLALLVMALLQMMGGGKRQSLESVSQAWKSARRAAKTGSVAILQALGVLTMISPLARAAQASSERMIPKGIIAPAAEDRNFWQDVFGMNSWTEPKPKETIGPSVPLKVSEKTVKAPQRQAQEAPKKQTQEAPKKKPRERHRWKSLANAYLSAEEFREMNRIREMMALECPKEYARAMAVARSGRAKKRAS